MMSDDGEGDFGMLLVSRRVSLEGRGVGYLYREYPDNNNDSGWRLLAGDEDENFVRGSRNFELVSVVTALQLDPTIAELLAIPAPCAFDREGPYADWRRVRPPRPR